jgi:hypothetical protein
MKTQIDDLSAELLTQAQQWLDDESNVIPVDIRFCLKMLLENMLKGEKSTKNAAKGFHELLVKFGFKPSSEKIKPSPLSKDAPSQEALTRLAKESNKAVAKFYSAQESLNESMKKEIFVECAERDSAQVQILIDHIKIADEAARDAAQNADLEARIGSGGAADPALAPADETLFPAAPVHATSSALHFSLNKNDLEKEFGRAARGLQKETIQTKRFDFSLQMHCFDVSYETARDPISGRSVSAAPETIGLKGFQISLRALVNLVLLTVAFLIPMHRVSRMLGNARIFHRSNLARYLGVVAQKALPVYLHMARELSNAKFLWADATPTRVNDVNAAIEKRKMWNQGDLVGPCEPYPWEALSAQERNQMREAENKNLANEGDSLSDDESEEYSKPLWRQLQDEFGYAFSEKGKRNSRPKTRHQTMVIHGRADPLDATSHTVLFRSCLGDVGNVLDKILQQRSIKNKELYLQCDHSSANLPSDPNILKRISLTVAGCLAHARRPFKKHFNQDPERCQEFLSVMFQVTHFESRLKKQGKNRTNTLSVRRSWSAHILEMLQFGMQLAIQDPNWSDQTPLGKAARHFIKHFKKLTVYLNHPELEATNNGSERLLRPEKLSQGSSYFRDSLEGRARFDILRSLHQTCVSAGIPLSSYLLHLLLTPGLVIQQNPENFTPRAVKKLLAEKPTLKTKLERILTQGY